jgi:glycosyltransferase involved in cell wall biosynthesis
VIKIKKKISLFIPTLEGAGAEKIVLTLANSFVSKGYHVDLIVIKFKGAFCEQVDSSINVINLNCKRVIFSLFPLINYLNLNKPDILLASLTHINIVSIIAGLFSRVKTKVIVIEHSLKTKLFKNLNLKNRMVDLFMLFTYPKAYRVVAVSKEVAKNISVRSGIELSKIDIINNPIYSNSIILKSKENLNHPWFLENQPPVILSVGRLTEEKNFSLLIRAFANVRNKYNVRLLILGEGKLREQLTALASKLGVEKDFCMPGFVENPYAYMSRASLFVMSSDYEGFGNVLVEAMACGTPIISTNCPGGPAEILENGLWGELVPVGDLKTLTSSIINTFNKKNHLNNSKRVNDFDIDMKIQEYVKIMFQN